MAESSVISLAHYVAKFLEENKIDYVLIGGLAVNIWGEPRMTSDVDLVLAISPPDYDYFIETISKSKFKVDRKKVLSSLKKMGMCQLFYDRRVDFIMGFSDFEKKVFLRKKKVDFFGQDIYIASAEDVIIYKLMAARGIDLEDVKRMFYAQGKNLDINYMRSRAARMQHELHRADITANLEKYLAEIT